MRETTKYKKLQGTEQLTHAPHKNWKKTSLAETHVINRGGGDCYIKAPQLRCMVHKQDNPPDIWDKSKDGGANSVHLFELEYIPKRKHEMTWPNNSLERLCFNSPTLLGAGLEQDLRCTGELWQLASSMCSETQQPPLICADVRCWPLPGHQHRATVDGDVSIGYQFL